MFIALAVVAQAQNEITYEVSFPNIAHHEAEISMRIDNLPVAPLKFRMSRSSPGRYATHEFGKNIYQVKALDAAGKPLSVQQTAGDEYLISKPGKAVKISYTLYGNWIDGTYAAFDESHAHMNMPAVFIWPVGYDARPRTVQFNYPEQWNWKVATQLKPLGSNKFYAPNLQYFMDSPIEITNHKSISWDVSGPDGKKQTIHYIAHSFDTQQGVDSFAVLLKKIVEEQKAIWGEMPKFDYGHYYFIHDVNPENYDDGMEHRNSTIITINTPQVEGHEQEVISTFSHEFFHAWNVERLRPKSLEPFDFTHSNITNELWIAEGFTQYYSRLVLKRTDIRSLGQTLLFLKLVVNGALNTPGARDFSPLESSRYAVLADEAASIDFTNTANIFTTYYTYGAAVALALDLRLRAEFKLSLDDYMRRLWSTNGKTEIPYTEADLEKALAAITANPAFAADFFNKYIRGTAKNDYAALLLKAGFVTRKVAPKKAWTGLPALDYTERGARITSNTLKGTPAYLAGLDMGDVILTVNGNAIKDQSELSGIVARRKTGESLDIRYMRRGEEKTTRLITAEDPQLEVVAIEQTGGQLTAEMRLFRDNWLNTKVR